MIVSNGDATRKIKDSECFLNICHVFLNGLRGLKLELMELVCRFPYVAILCSIDMIIYDLEPLNGIVLGKNMFDKIV